MMITGDRDRESHATGSHKTRTLEYGMECYKFDVPESGLGWRP